MDTRTILEILFAVAICVGGALWLWFHPSRRQYDPDELVTVAEFSNATEARLWKMRLESMGVQCVLQNEITNTLGRHMIASEFTSVRLQVMGCDVGRAKRAISAS